MNEDTNASIKKYKAVVKEYFKKYNQEIKISPLGRQISTKSLIKETLTKGKLVTDSINPEEILMVYWMIEFMGLNG